MCTLEKVSESVFVKFLLNGATYARETHLGVK